MTNLTDLFSPADHQRIINRYTRMMNGKAETKMTKAKLAEKIEWHTAEYLAKTGNLPK